MKITLKTLKGQQLPLEVQPEMTVAALKALIAETHGQDASTQKLIAYGKVMEDETKTVADYKIVENGFIVMMVAKAKPVRAAAAEDAKQEEVAQPGVTLPAQADQPAQAQAAASTAPANNPPVQQPPTTQVDAQVDPVTGLPPGVDEEAVSTIVAITGKPRDQCIQALQLSRGDADLACTLLLEGVDLNRIPSGGQEGYADDYGDEDAGAGQPGAGGMPGGGMGMPGGQNAELMGLMSNPQFANMAQRMRENPQFYQQFMSRLEQDNPQIYAAIQQNPMAFMNMIMGGNPNIGGGMPPMGGAQPGAGGPPGGAPRGQPAGPRPGQIQVTQQEMESIQRLESLGFSRHRCLEAFLACDKNEEFAANFLFENGGDDDAEMMQAAIAQSTAAAAEGQPDVVMAEAQPEPVVEQPVADAQPVAGEQPVADAQPAEADPAAAQQPPADNAQPNNDAGANNNGEGNGDGDAGAGDGGEKSAFE